MADTKSFRSGERYLSIVPSSCCFVITANIDGDAEEVVDLRDLTRLIDFLFISFIEPECPAEANVDDDPSDQSDIGDLTALIDHLSSSFTPPADCFQGGEQ